MNNPIDAVFLTIRTHLLQLHSSPSCLDLGLTFDPSGFSSSAFLPLSHNNKLISTRYWETSLIRASK